LFRPRSAIPNFRLRWICGEGDELRVPPAGASPHPAAPLSPQPTPASVPTSRPPWTKSRRHCQRSGLHVSRIPRRDSGRQAQRRERSAEAYLTVLGDRRYVPSEVDPLRSLQAALGQGGGSVDPAGPQAGAQPFLPAPSPIDSANGITKHFRQEPLAEAHLQTGGRVRRDDAMALVNHRPAQRTKLVEEGPFDMEVFRHGIYT